MQQTEHLGLNQWELSDRIQMKDFNADNQKIDGALQAVGGALQCHPSGELLIDFTVSEESSKLEFDITGIDWSRYLMLFLEVTAKDTGTIRIYMSSGDEWAVTIYRANETVSSSFGVAGFPMASHLTLLIPVLYSANTVPSALSFGFGANVSPGSNLCYGLLGGGGGEWPLRRCTKISVERNSELYRQGDRVLLWGVK